MSCLDASASSARSSSSMSLRAMTIFAIITTATFSAASGAPTPLYRLYQDGMNLSPFLMTMIFATYVFTLLVALLTVGSLSDYVGRRPVIFTALALNAIAMLVFIQAQSPMALIAARIVQGFATGAATTTLGAAILDTNRTHGPLFNSATPFAGLTLGALGASILVTYAPHPMQLVYLVLLGASLIEAVLLWRMPETAAGRPGAFASLRPQLRVPAQARHAFFRVTPVNVAAWALGGFYFSLMPSVVRIATGLASPLVGGSVVAALTLSATAAILLSRKQVPLRALVIGTPVFALGVAITLAGVRAQLVPLLLLGTIVAGLGFGATFSGTIRSVLPLAAAHERAGLLSAYYVQSYLAFSLPAVLAGLMAPVLGLTLCTYIYGAAVVLLATMSLSAFRTAHG